MSTYGRFTAAAGSLALNVLVALVLSQAAGAAAVPAADASVQGSHTYTVHVGTDRAVAHEKCTGGIRTRAIIAVVLGLIV
jgi:hypothetical protein